MKKLLLLLLLVPFIAKAEKYSMRDCLILPVTDSAGNSLGLKIYEEVEYYLKEKAWCNYESNAELFEIFL